MNKAKIIAISLTIAIVGSAAICFMLLTKQNDGKFIEIKQDNKVIDTIDISKDRTFDVIYQDRINTIEIKNNQVRIIYADCPDQTCKQMGYLKQLPLTCLPNHLSISFVNEKTTDTIAK